MQVRPIIRSPYSSAEIQTLAKNTLRETDSLRPKQVVITALSGSLKAAYESLKKARGNSNHNTQTQR